MISKEEAINLLHSKMQSVNLRRHCYGVGAVMRALALHFNSDKSASAKATADRWEIVGLLHDGDYEITKDDPGNHAKLMAKWVTDTGETDEELLTGIESHGWFHEGKLPQSKMQWALFCCDELTGLIVAVTLIRPTKKLADVTVENILDKWGSKSFAAGVDRTQIEKCEKELEIPLKNFIAIALKAMQGIHSELGL